MNAYALKNYSQKLPGLGSGKRGTSYERNHSFAATGNKRNIYDLKLLKGKNNKDYSVAREFKIDYKFSKSRKRGICKLNQLQGSTAANYSYIARESNKNYRSSKQAGREHSARFKEKLSDNKSKIISGNHISGGNFAESSNNYLSKSDGTAGNPASLSDSALVAGLENLRGKERKIQLDILLYIVELEKRKLYLLRGYNSLFEFCTRQLGYSRASAYRRIQASKCIGRFPKVANMLLTGELNISIVSLISGILTIENINTIISLVRGKSYRDAEIAIVMYKPIETKARDKIKPVSVLEKKSGPDIMTNRDTKNTDICLNVETNRRNSNNNNINEIDFSPGADTSSVKETSKEETEGLELKQKFKLEFMVDPEFIKKLDRIKSQLSRKYPKGVNFEMLFTVVIDEYLDRHSPEKRIQRREKRGADKQNKEAMFIDKEKDRNKAKASRDKQALKTKGVSSKQKENIKKRQKINKDTANGNNNRLRTNKERTRNIPAAVRDKVFKRDGGKCTFAGNNGNRCNSTWNLQIDHIVPFAKGGDNSLENLRLLCERHNKLEAERAYGKEFMKRYNNKK